MAKSSLPYLLVLVGGVVTLAVGVLAGFFSTSAVLSSFTAIPLLNAIAVALVGIYAAWGIIVAILLIWSADKIRKGGASAKTGVLVAAVFSILGLVSLEGLIIGPVIALVGAAISYGELKKK